MAEGIIPWEQLTILLTVATASHFAFRRFKQPTIMGEVLIGIVLGPSLLGLIIGPSGLNLIPETSFFDPVFTGIFAAFGAIVLLFLIGLESDIYAIYSRKNIAIAFGGVIVPWVTGYFVADIMLPNISFVAKVFIGATMVATSAAITAAILLELKVIRTDVGRTIIGAAVVDDVLGLIVLSISIQLEHGALNPTNVALLILGAVLFLGIGTLIGIRYLTRLIDWAEKKGQKYDLKHTGFTLGLGVMFLYAFLSISAGLHPIVGAFLAGAFISKSTLSSDFQQGAEYLGAIFTPVFFVSLGIQVDLTTLNPGLIFFGLVLTAVAIPAKVFGCYFPARAAKMSKCKSLTIGLGMAPRGEVGLAIASTAIGLAIIDADLYSITVLTVLLTTIIPPVFFRIGLKACIREDQREKKAKIAQKAKEKPQ